MENILIYSSLSFLIIFLIFLNFKSRDWNDTPINFLFANRSLKILETGSAISSHWFWAIAIFVGPIIAYKWGIFGILWFVIPNALSLVIVGIITNKIRNNNTQVFSLTQYIKEKFDQKLSTLFQIEFLLVSFAALLLAFTAIGKLWEFLDLAKIIQPIYFSLIIGLITLYFTLKGGIRTSIFTGSIQTLLWSIFLMSMLIIGFNKEYTFLSYGTNNLTSIFREDFLSTFAITWLISILVGATAHGMMWQKSFSMPTENIIPSYILAAIVFLFVCAAVSSMGMIAHANGFRIISLDTAQMTTVLNLSGVAGIIVMGTLIIGQTSTVIDSSLNYVASLISAEWFKYNSVYLSRIIMTMFLLFAWFVSWLKLEIWTILLLMSSVRIVMFIPIVAHTLGINLHHKKYFYILVLSIIVSFSLFVCARIFSIPYLEMTSAIFAISFPIFSLLILKWMQK